MRMHAYDPRLFYLRNRETKSMTPLWQLSAVDQAAGIRIGDFSSTAVVESVLERVAQKNPELNAIVDPQIMNH